jgi:hypothetical protein
MRTIKTRLAIDCTRCGTSTPFVTVEAGKSPTHAAPIPTAFRNSSIRCAECSSSEIQFLEYQLIE